MCLPVVPHRHRHRLHCQVRESGWTQALLRAKACCLAAWSNKALFLQAMAMPLFATVCVDSTQHRAHFSRATHAIFLVCTWFKMFELCCVLSFLTVTPSHPCFTAPCLTHSCLRTSLHRFVHVRAHLLRCRMCSLAVWLNSPLSQNLRGVRRLTKTTKSTLQNQLEIPEDAIHWINFGKAQDKGIQFGQTRSHAIILYDSLPADCIERVVSTERAAILYQRISTPRPLSKIVLQEARQVQSAGKLQRQKGIVKSIAEQEEYFKIVFPSTRGDLEPPGPRLFGTHPRRAPALEKSAKRGLGQALSTGSNRGVQGWAAQKILRLRLLHSCRARHVRLERRVILLPYVDIAVRGRDECSAALCLYGVGGLLTNQHWLIVTELVVSSSTTKWFTVTLAAIAATAGWILWSILVVLPCSRQPRTSPLLSMWTCMLTPSGRTWNACSVTREMYGRVPCEGN